MSLLPTRKSCGCPLGCYCMHGQPDMDDVEILDLGYAGTEALTKELERIVKEMAEMASQDDLKGLDPSAKTKPPDLG